MRSKWCVWCSTLCPFYELRFRHSFGILKISEVFSGEDHALTDWEPSDTFLAKLRPNLNRRENDWLLSFKNELWLTKFAAENGGVGLKNDGRL